MTLPSLPKHILSLALPLALAGLLLLAMPALILHVVLLPSLEEGGRSGVVLQTYVHEDGDLVADAKFGGDELEYDGVPEKGKVLAYTLWKAPKSGLYGFLFKTDDYGYLNVDGEKVIQLEGLSAHNSGRAWLELEAGWHLIVVESVNLVGRGWFELERSLPGGNQVCPFGEENLRRPDLGNFEVWWGILETARRLSPLGWAALVLAALLLVAGFLPPRARKIGKVAAVQLAILAGLLGLAEMALSWIEYPEIPRAGWKSKAPWHGTNEIGFRGRPIRYDPDDFVVLLVGDSQVEAVALPNEEIPEIILERRLRRARPDVKVFSIGGGGYGTAQQLLALEQYFNRYRADLVVLWQTVDNDIFNNVFPTHWPGHQDGYPSPTYRLLEDGRLHGPNAGLEEPLHDWRLAALVKTAAHRMAGGMDAYWEKNHLPESNPPLDAADLAKPEVADLPVHRAAPEENLASGKSHLYLMLTPASPRQNYGVALTRALLDEMRRECSLFGARLVSFHEDRRPSLQKEFGGGNSRFLIESGGQKYLASLDQRDELLEEMNQGLDHVVLPITVEDWTVSDTDSHLNLQANRQLLGDLGDWLVNQGLLKSRPGCQVQ